MRVITGKQIRRIDATEFAGWIAGYRETTLDLGAGDGRFVRDLARQRPEIAAIGVDLSAGHLKATSRRAPGNALFVIADALAMPEELRGVATRVTINFPWGSLLRGLLHGGPGLLAGLIMAARPGAHVRIAINASALAEEGWTLESGREQLAVSLKHAGVTGVKVTHLGPAELRRWPTTWAKRLAFGRDPHALCIEARVPRAAVLPTSAQAVLAAPEASTRPAHLAIRATPGTPALTGLTR